MSTRSLYDLKKRKVRYRVLLVEKLSDLSGIDGLEGGFVLLLVDIKWKEHTQEALATAHVLLQKGLRHFGAWADGNAEGLHDLFDEAIFDGKFEGDGSLIMTTWHDKESLSDAVWYMNNCAILEPPFDVTCRNWIVAVVAEEAFARTAVEAVQENLGLFPKGWKAKSKR
jgi:hypothetical protein